MPPLLTPTPAGLLRDGQPHVIISGALHYFRVDPGLWRDRLRRLVAMGCDTVETYVAWNVHQPAVGRTTFKNSADLGRFLDIAAEEGLDAIVRPGPYICAEWENGGFPGWLLADRNLRLRTSDPAYLRHVDAWFDELVPLIAERQASRGGNVVMVQVENEYGSYGDDTAYLEHLRDGLRRRGIDELLVTSDGPGRMWLSGGTVDGALATVNFGSRTDEVLDMLRRELPGQPYMCMEFWNGWFDHWGERHHTRDASDAAGELDRMLAAGMSVNFYMAHGGTNIGLTAGANHDGVLQPTTTSYDYDAPIAEDGTLTPKFHAFREVIARYRELPPLDEHLAQLGIDAEPAALAARELAIEHVVPVRDTDLFTRPARRAVVPPAFGDIGLERGVLRLSRDLELEAPRRADGGAAELTPLRLFGLADRAWVFVDGVRIGAVGLGAGVGADATGADSADVPGPDPSAEFPLGRPDDPAVVDLAPFTDELLPGGGRRTVRLDLLVENLGRVNFGPHLGQRKGILGGVWHEVRYLNGWDVDAWPLEDMGAELAGLVARAGADAADGGAAGGGGSPVAATLVDGADVPAGTRVGGARPGTSATAASLPLLVSASFEVDTPADAHLDVSGAGHGVAYVNGRCAGRYWSVGPQQTLFVPGTWIRPGRNDVLLLEFDRVPTRLALAATARLG